MNWYNEQMTLQAQPRMMEKDSTDDDNFDEDDEDADTRHVTFAD